MNIQCDDDRTEAVLRRLQQRAPVMSDAEKDALSELRDIQVLLSSYTSKIKTVHINCLVFVVVTIVQSYFSQSLHNPYLHGNLASLEQDF